MKLGSFVPSKGNYSPCRMQTNKQMQINQEKHGGFFSTRFNICLKLTNPAGNSQVLFFPIQIHSWLSLEMLVWVTVQQGEFGWWAEQSLNPNLLQKTTPLPPQKTTKNIREGGQSMGCWRGELESPSSCCWELPPAQSSPLRANQLIPAMPGGTASSLLRPSAPHPLWCGQDHAGHLCPATLASPIPGQFGIFPSHWGMRNTGLAAL